MYEKREGVWVRSDLKNRQKEFCMCWDCKKFCPQEINKGCAIVMKVLELASQNKIVLPIWECPDFLDKNRG